VIRTLRAAVVCLLFFALLLACANYAIHKAHARECSSSSAARAEWLGCPTHAALPAVEEVAGGASTSPTARPIPRVAPRVVPSVASRSRPFIRTDGVGSARHLNWRALRDCESSNNYTDRDSATYRGAYQFDLETWQSVGGTGDPADASPAEQDHRAQLLYAVRGRQPWPVCGRWL